MLLLTTCKTLFSYLITSLTSGQSCFTRHVESKMNNQDPGKYFGHSIYLTPEATCRKQAVEVDAWTYSLRSAERSAVSILQNLTLREADFRLTSDSGFLDVDRRPCPAPGSQSSLGPQSVSSLCLGLNAGLPWAASCFTRRKSAR